MFYLKYLTVACGSSIASIRAVRSLRSSIDSLRLFSIYSKEMVEMHHLSAFLQFTLLTLCCVASHVFAQGSQGSFLKPPPPGPDNVYTGNAIYEVGQTVQVQWTTVIPNTTLLLWQNSNSSTATSAFSRLFGMRLVTTEDNDSIMLTAS